MFKFILGKCPLNGQEYTASDWWYVVSRHKDFDCAEDALAKISKEKKAVCKYQIFKLNGYQTGEEFNIRRIREND